MSGEAFDLRDAQHALDALDALDAMDAMDATDALDATDAMDAMDERAERELFAQRRQVLRPPPALEARVLAAVDEAAQARSTGWKRVGGATRVAVALAACVAAVVGDPAGLRGQGHPGETHAAIHAAIHAGRGDTTSLSASLASVDEPLACALPASGFIRASDRVVACGMPTSAGALFSAPDRQLCEEVTSSFATP